RIGCSFDNSGEDIVSRAVSGLRRRTERFSLASDSDRRGLFWQKLLPAYVTNRHFREIDVAALPVEIAEKRIESCNRPAGLRCIRVLAEAVPHEHADRAVVRQQKRRLPDFLGGDAGNFFRTLGRKTRGNRAETFEDGLCRNC